MPAYKYNKFEYSLGNGKFLTLRQTEVLKQLSLGYSNKQIAHNLKVTEPTVKMHVSALLRVFAAQNRVQVILEAAKRKFI